ncbi:unnamed protein product [Larinioides sclopetarius]|uniref:Uncharacterized protein n=1 Tax=Larinioides sclopetarius TaxID=280406 RepID=A0AAV1ZXS2_9ARAC
MNINIFLISGGRCRISFSKFPGQNFLGHKKCINPIKFIKGMTVCLLMRKITVEPEQHSGLVYFKINRY